MPPSIDCSAPFTGRRSPKSGRQRPPRPKLLQGRVSGSIVADPIFPASARPRVFCPASHGMRAFLFSLRHDQSLHNQAWRSRITLVNARNGQISNLIQLRNQANMRQKTCWKSVGDRSARSQRTLTNTPRLRSWTDVCNKVVLPDGLKPPVWKAHLNLPSHYSPARQTAFADVACFTGFAC